MSILSKQVQRFKDIEKELTILLERQPTIGELRTEFGKEIKPFCNLTVDEEQSVVPTAISLNDRQVLRLPSFAHQDMRRRAHQEILSSKLRPLIESIPLTKRQREVLDLRYGFSKGFPHTYRQIGMLLGVCGARVRQIDCAALEKMQQFCGDRLFELIKE